MSLNNGIIMGDAFNIILQRTNLVILIKIPTLCKGPARLGKGRRKKKIIL